MGKSLLPENSRGTYQVQQWHFPAWPKTLVEALQRFILRKSGIAEKWLKSASDLGSDNHHITAVDYSRMNYAQLRNIADNDAIAGHLSEEEYDALSAELWRQFSVENGLK